MNGSGTEGPAGILGGSTNYEGAVCTVQGTQHHSYRTWPLQMPQVVSLQNSSYFDGIQEIQDWLSARL